MKKYMRFGEIPPNERSVNFYSMSLDDNASFSFDIEHGDVDIAYEWVKEKDLEKGVSVFELDDNNNPITDNEELEKDLKHRIEKKFVCYIVTGDKVGIGCDGEPLIRNIKILEKR